MAAENRDMPTLADGAGVVFSFSLPITPFVVHLAKRRGLVDQPGGERNPHSEPVSRVGGVGGALAFLGTPALPPVLPLELGWASQLPRGRSGKPAGQRRGP